MLPDSDTESESENSQLCDNGPPTIAEIPPSDPQSVHAAVESLKGLEGEDIQQDDKHHNDILIAANTIVGFLSDPFATVAFDGGDVRICLSAFVAILDPSFLSLLFTYRRIFHVVAARALAPGTSISTVVCWVDSILAHLSEATVTIANGLSPRQQTQDHLKNLESLKRQSVDNDLRAAAQLPEKWQSVPKVISSEHASPAAKRLALRLTFAVYVLGPQFVDHDPWKHGGVQPSDMMGILQTCISQLDFNCSQGRSLPKTGILKGDRLSCAMMVSLAATAESLHRESEALAPFRPQSLASLLVLIQHVLGPQDSQPQNLVLPREVLDLPETILVRWGSTVRWCWGVWGDQRVAHAECTTYVTATWLFQLDKPLFGENLNGETEAWKTDMMPHLVQKPLAASSGMLQVLHQIVLLLSSKPERVSQSLVNVLSKCCWAIVQLLKLGLANPMTDQSPALEFCKFLCFLFGLLGDTEGEIRIKYLVVEGLALVPREQFDLAMIVVQSDPKIPFVTKLDEALSRSKRTVVVDGNKFSSETHLLHEAKLLLEFLVVSWQNGSRGFLRGQIASLFLALLVATISVEDPNSFAWDIICDVLLSTLATVEQAREDPSFRDVFKLWEDGTVWLISMKSRRSALPVAAAFAHYVIFSPSVCNPLYCAAAWDYFRDVMLLILSRNFLGEDEPLALAICPSICHALLCLLQRAGPSAVRFILSSPWTMTLSADLLTALDVDGTNNKLESKDEYSKIFRDRLDEVGKVLLDRIKRKSESDTAGPSIKIPELKLGLMFCHLRSVPRLITLPA